MISIRLIVAVLVLGASPREAKLLGKTIRLPADCALKQEKTDNASVECPGAATVVYWSKLDKPLSPKILDALAARMSKQHKVLSSESPACSIMGLPATCRRMVTEMPSGP